MLLDHCLYKAVPSEAKPLTDKASLAAYVGGAYTWPTEANALGFVDALGMVVDANGQETESTLPYPIALQYQR
jgi:hypothetical protein